MRRAASASGRIYCLANADLLNYDVIDRAEKELKQTANSCDGNLLLELVLTVYKISLRLMYMYMFVEIRNLIYTNMIENPVYTTLTFVFLVTVLTARITVPKPYQNLNVCILRWSYVYILCIFSCNYRNFQTK